MLKIILYGIIFLFLMTFAYADGYSESLIKDTKWFNLDVFDTATITGIIFYFGITIILIGLVVYSEMAKIPMLMILTGIFGFFFSFLLYTTISAIIGILFTIGSIFYMIRSTTV